MGERNALSVVRDEGGNELNWWAMAKEQAAMLVKTGFLPTSIKTVEQCLAIMLKGRELAIPSMYALSNIAVINGKPTCGAELMMALVHRDHGRDAIRVKLSTNEKCTVEWKEWGTVGEYSFTLEDAKRADLLNKPGPWKQYPAAMLRARAISAACRMAFPGSIAGMYTPEELGAVVTVGDDGAVEIVNDPRHADYIASAKPAPTPIKPTVEVVEPQAGPQVRAEDGQALKAAKGTLWRTAEPLGLTVEMLNDFSQNEMGAGLSELSLPAVLQLTQRLKTAAKDDPGGLLDRLLNPPPSDVIDAETADMFPDIESFDAGSPERFTR